MTPAGDGQPGTIRYTTNGNAPTASSTVYNGPFSVSSTTIVRARVFAGATGGDESGAVYTATSGLASSDLPIVIVDSLGQNIPQSDVSATITVIDTDGGVASPLGEADFSGRTDIKVRGSSSANFPKKQFKIELADPSGTDVDADLLGLGEEEDWILYAPGRYDRSIVANALAQTLAGQLGLVEMEHRWVEVYLNDDGGQVTASDYHGLYLLLESIKIGDNRVDVAKPDPADVTGGYIVSLDRSDSGQHRFTTAADQDINVVQPKSDDLTSGQRSYIEGFMGDFESALYGPNFTDPNVGYRAFVDVPSFINAHIVRYMAKDPDSGRLSTFFSKDAGGLLRADPIWDLDRGYNSDDQRSDEPAEPRFEDNGTDPLNEGYWGRMFEDPQFRLEYVSRWNQLRASLLSDASVQNLIDSIVADTGTAYPREDARWGSTNNYGSRFGNFAGEINALKNWLAVRMNFMDETLNELLLSDLAEGRPASQSSTSSDDGAGRALDGEVNGRLSDNSVTQTNSESEPWWQVDLGSVQDIGSVRLWNRSDCCADRLSDVHVLVSDVPFVSESLGAAQAQAGVGDFFFAGEASRTESIDVGRSGRYVRVQLEGNGILSLAEVDVIEDTEPPPPPTPVEPGLILNEWNAVSSTNLINGGDSFFGSTAGNGGDWFELVVVEDNLDVRGWQLELADSDGPAPEITDTFIFADDPLLADLRAGTIITVAEDVADDVSFQPATGDFTINLQANTDDDGAFFTASSQSNFDTNNNDWQLRIIDASGLVRFGPAGEGIAGVSGVGGSEVGELEVDPNSSITPLSGYDDGDASTFGSANESGGVPQDFAPLRGWFVPDATPPSTTTGLSVVATTNSTVELSWIAATDNVGVVNYHILRDDAPVGTSTTTTFTDTGLTLGTTYEYRVIAVDAAGNESVSSAAATGTTGGAADTLAPDTSLDAPTANQVLTSVEFTASGTATDGVGVQQVQVAIRDRDNDAWLRVDGTYGALQWLDATVVTPGALSTSWSFSTTLDDGNWFVMARGIDAADNVEAERPGARFAIDSAPPPAPDVDAPDGAIGAPTLDQAVAGPVVSFAGTATDDVAVRRVKLTVRNLDTGDYLQPDGTFGAPFARVIADLSDPETTATDWSLDADLVDGVYSVLAYVADATGKTDPEPARVGQFTVGSATVDTEDADATIDAPAEGEGLPGPEIEVSGSATDNVGVTVVRVALQNRDTGQWLQSDGTFGGFAFVGATLTSPVGPDTTWSFPINLDPGSYRATVVAVDGAGNADSTRPAVNFTVGDAVVDDEPADSSINAPAEGEAIAGPSVNIAGSATDNVGVTAVRLALQDRDTRLWLQPDGSFGGFAFVSSDVASPGDPTISWSLPVDLAPGTYRVTAVAVDGAGNADLTRPSVNFTVS